jgi:hypothetical protein
MYPWLRLENNTDYSNVNIINPLMWRSSGIFRTNKKRITRFLIPHINVGGGGFFPHTPRMCGGILEI